MNMNDLTSVSWGDVEGLQVMMFENALQHSLFKRTLVEQGIGIPVSFNLFDIDLDNTDDWQLCHQREHRFFAAQLGLTNPVNLLDLNFNNEDQFYDWVSDHYNTHAAIAAALGISTNV